MEDLKLFKAISSQNVENEKEIDFTCINNKRTPIENKYRWNRIKKLVNTRYTFDTDTLMTELGDYFKRISEQKRQVDANNEEGVPRNQSNNLLAFFRNEYSS